MHEWAPRSGAVLLSLLLHGWALLLMYTWTLTQPGQTGPLIFPVTVLAPKQPAGHATMPESAPEPPPPAEIPLPEQQIVSPPEAGTNQPPPETRFLSDRDVSVAEQMVRRGEPASGGEGSLEGDLLQQESKEEAGQHRETGEPPPAVPPLLASLPGLEQLLPSAVELAGDGYGRESQASEPTTETKKRDPGRRSPDAWLPVSSLPGTLDYLPGVRPGDITLLNTKADVFAPFVRRVALRVFQNLLISLQRELASTQATARESVEAEAIMDPRGDMLSLRITQRSSDVSLGTDRKLREACSQAFFDRNPPPGAEAQDGNIHFVLRIHVAAVSHGGERYGYRVAFEAGLL